MQKVDPRDQWEYFRIRAQALGHPALLPSPSGEDGRDSLVKVLSVRKEAGSRSLREILASQNRLSPDRAVWIALGICSQLNRLHQLGAVQGDLRPKDIIVGSEDQVRIADSAGCEVRDAAYISPEQALGRTGSAPSDIYAAGVILYEMLTGALPFEGPDSFASMNDRVENDPVPPREITSAVSPELQEIIYRALDREPKRRFASVAEMAWALSHPEQVTPQDRPELQNWRKRRSPWRRFLVDLFRPLGAVAVVTALLYLLVGRG